MEFVIMLVNFLCTAFEPFAPVFWHYVASIYPVCVYCATKFLQCGVVAFIIYLIVHIYRLERREERREDRRQERRNQTNTPAATITNTSEPILLLRAEIEKMQLHTRLLQAELEEVEEIAILAEADEAHAALFSRQTRMYYERIHADHISREREDRQVVIDLMRAEFRTNRHQLTAAQCANVEVRIQKAISDQNAKTNRLDSEEQVAMNERSNLEYLRTDRRKRDNERRVLVAAEMCFLSHTQRLETNARQAESLWDHLIRMSTAR